MTPVVYTNVVLHINCEGFTLPAVPALCLSSTGSPPVFRAVSVWKPGRGGVAYISTRERASSGASAHTPHVEGNILY